MHFQVAEVDRPFISVARLVDAGNRAVFEPSGGSITHVDAGRCVQLTRDCNVYALGMHLPPEPEEEEEKQRCPEPEATSAAAAAAVARPAASAATVAVVRPTASVERPAPGFARPEC